MAKTALEILSLDEFKEEVGVPLNITQLDSRLTRNIEDAVDMVARANGIPLTEEERVYDLAKHSGEYYRVAIPIGWDTSFRLEKLNYINSETMESVERDAKVDDNIPIRIPGPLYLARSTNFDLNEWPSMAYPTVTVTIGIDTNRNALRRAVIVAARANYHGVDYPEKSLQQLLR